MNGLPYYKAYPRDFVEGTIGMSFEMKGAYRIVLDLIYMQGGNLPDDARYICGLLGCSIRKWKSLRDDLIAAGKLEVSGEFLTNKRAEKELETLAKLQETQREKASKPRKNKGLTQPRQCQPEPEPEPKIREDANASSLPRKRAKRLPADWQLPDEWKDWAVSQQGMTPEAVSIEAEKFRDYWVAKGGKDAAKLDWQATWRNWCRNASSRSPAHAANVTQLPRIRAKF